MRTKHILTALAIPALFAACVADDFNEAVTGSDMAQRALLSEDFKLNFGGADTRFSAGDAGAPLEFSYEVGDAIGGAIIDQFDPTQTDPVKRFPIVPYVSTNHPFVLNAQGEWAIEHTMVEGNYLFYFPYNENNHARTAPVYSIPVMQDLSDKDGKFDPKAAVEKYNMAVGVQFLEKEDLNASLQLVNIYGYARIKVTLDNHYAGSNVDKIVLQADNEKPFVLSGQLSNSKISTLYKSEDFAETLKTKTATSDFELLKDDTDAEGYYDEEMVRISPVMVAKAPEGTAMEVDAQNNKTFETYIVIPAGTYEKAVNVYLYTTDGNIYAGSVANLTVDRNKVKGVEVTVRETESVPYVVTSEADWNNNVAMLTKNQKDDKAAEFIIANNDFAITNNTKYPTNGAEIKVTGDLKVAGNNVTIKNVAADNVIIEKGAKLTTNGTFAAASIENNGELVFAPVYDEEDEDEVVNYDYMYDGDAKVVTKNGVEVVVNKATGKVTVSEKAIATFELTNEIDEDKASIHGEMTIAKDAKVTLTAGSTNSGLITNNGTLNGTFTNNEEIVYTAAGETKEESTNRYTPTIVNNANITIDNGTLTNEGDIENNQGAVISCVNNSNIAQINNSGSIDVAVGSRMLITSNTNGEVILHALNQTNWTIQNKNDETSVVAYETTAADNTTTGIDFTTTGKNITKLYVTGSLNIAKMGTSLNNIEMTEEATAATLILPEKANWNGKLTVKEGANVVITEAKASADGMTLGDLVVEEKATLTVNEDDKLTVSTVNNNGTVYVGGYFEATTTKEENAGKGKFLSTSDTGDVVFNDSLGTEVETALAGLYTTWITNTGTVAADGTLSWGGVVDKITKETEWTNTTSASGEWKKAMDAVVKAAKLDGSITLEKFREYLQTPAVTKVIKETVDAAETAADKLLKAEIEKVTLNWLGTDAYLEKTAGSIIKVGTEDDTTPVTLAKGFGAYISSETGFLSGRSNSSKAEKEMILSAKSYTYTAGDEPDFSYAPAYAGTAEYEVLEGLNTLVNSSDVQASWFGVNGTNKYIHANFDELLNVQTAVRKVVEKLDDTKNPLGTVERLVVESCNMDDYLLEVLDWKYSDATIAALNDLFAPAN